MSHAFADIRLIDPATPLFAVRDGHLATLQRADLADIADRLTRDAQEVATLAALPEPHRSWIALRLALAAHRLHELTGTAAPASGRDGTLDLEPFTLTPPQAAPATFQ